MSPEQGKREIDRRSDVFALGILLFESPHAAVPRKEHYAILNHDHRCAAGEQRRADYLPELGAHRRKSAWSRPKAAACDGAEPAELETSVREHSSLPARESGVTRSCSRARRRIPSAGELPEPEVEGVRRRTAAGEALSGIAIAVAAALLRRDCPVKAVPSNLRVEQRAAR
jgi:hypothetical protein